MTEQEKRKKAIYEMAESICPKFEIQCYDCHRDCNVEEDSERLYDAGYRKADEVRKETAKRFLKMLYDIGVDRQTIETCGIYDVNGSELARFVSQEFGVEVEE